jgi:RadC-like JAB domain
MATAQFRHNPSGHICAVPVLDDRVQIASILAAPVDGLAACDSFDPYCQPVCTEFDAGCLRDSAGHMGLFSICDDTLCNSRRQAQSRVFDETNKLGKASLNYVIKGHLSRLSIWKRFFLGSADRAPNAITGNAQPPVLLGSNDAIGYLMPKMVNLRVETFRVIFLDAHNHLLGDEVMWTGTIDKVQVYPREIMRRAIELDSSAMILAHNHPSQVHAPSPADIIMTRKIIASGRTLGIAVHDHFIISRRGFHSMRTHKSIDPWN